jgi:nucleotide-binding universal stress UspA family protein
MTTRFLVPIDGSEGALRAVRLAGSLARAVGGKVTLLHVFDMPSSVTLGMTGLSEAEVDARRRQLEDGMFADAERELEGVHTERRRELGEPSEQIVLLSEDAGYDHIVIGSRGLSLVKEIVLGSVSERVARRARCPVTLVR